MKKNAKNVCSIQPFFAFLHRIRNEITHSDVQNNEKLTILPQ